MPARTCPKKGGVFCKSRGYEIEMSNSVLDHLRSPDFQCNVPLGMESGRIANEQISASSTYSDGRWRPQQSRLHGDDNGWTPNLDSNKEYLQVLARLSEGTQSVSALVGKGGGSSSRVDKEHKDNKHSILENIIHSSIHSNRHMCPAQIGCAGTMLSAGLNDW